MAQVIFQRGCPEPRTAQGRGTPGLQSFPQGTDFVTAILFPGKNESQTLDMEATMGLSLRSVGRTGHRVVPKDQRGMKTQGY